MTEPVNLNKFRKARAKEEARRQAAENRVVHGLPKALKKLSEARADKARAELDAHKRDGGRDD
jgi:hypothetical protein